MGDQHTISFTENAKIRLKSFTKREQKNILTGIKNQLQYEVDVETKHRKLLRENPHFTWELRIEKFRVFYDVAQHSNHVLIVDIGIKVRNKLFIGNKEIDL